MRPLRLLLLAPVTLGLAACGSSSPAKRAPPPPTSVAPLPAAPAPAPVVSSPRSAPPARSSDRPPEPSREPTRSPAAPSTSSQPTVSSPPAPPSGSGTAPSAPSTRPPPSPVVRSPSAPPTGAGTRQPGTPTTRQGRTFEVADAPKGPAPRNAPTGVLTWQVHDSGIQCIAAPCPTYVATRQLEKAPQEIQFHELDLSKLSEKDQQRVNQSMKLQGSIALTGQFRTLPNRGPAGTAVVLVVERVGVSRPRR